jgi:hypothetical protein
MRYYNVGKLNKNATNVVVCEYEIDGGIFTAKNRFVDVQTGMPYYIYGGNVFEEFNPDVKSHYLYTRYNKKDVEALRQADAKLDVFLNKLDEILKDDKNNAVIYFTTTETLNYISKVLDVVYPMFNDERILTRTDSVLDGRFLKRRFSGRDDENARIILATDMIGERYHITVCQKRRISSITSTPKIPPNLNGGFNVPHNKAEARVPPMRLSCFLIKTWNLTGVFLRKQCLQGYIVALKLRFRLKTCCSVSPKQKNISWKCWRT